MDGYYTLEFAGAFVYWAASGFKGDVKSFLSKKGQPKKQIKNFITGWTFLILLGFILVMIFNS